MAVGKDLVAASATPLILSILNEGESYGYAIMKRVRELSGGRMQWTDGMLYPVLHRLERQGLIKSFERVSEAGRRSMNRSADSPSRCIATSCGMRTLRSFRDFGSICPARPTPVKVSPRPSPATRSSVLSSPVSSRYVTDVVRK